MFLKSLLHIVTSYQVFLSNIDNVHDYNIKYSNQIQIIHTQLYDFKYSYLIYIQLNGFNELFLFNSNHLFAQLYCFHVTNNPKKTIFTSILNTNDLHSYIVSSIPI